MFIKLLTFLLLIFLSPIIIIGSFFIFIEDGLPIMFSQKRIGINYSFFKIYKFRSMMKKTPNVATNLLTNPDQYLLKIGRFI